MTRGEALRVLVDYDLFDVNVNSFVGVYLKTDKSSGKHLVYFLELEEWGEFTDEQVERVNPDHVSDTYSEFVSRVKPLRITCETP